MTPCPCGRCGTPHFLGQLATYPSAYTVQRPPMRGLRRGSYIIMAVRFKLCLFAYCWVGLSCNTYTPVGSMYQGMFDAVRCQVAL